MLTITCDGCGRELPKHSLRYTVKIHVRAAYDQQEIHLIDMVRDHRKELADLVEKLGDKAAEELEEQVYKNFQLDLCPPCHQAFIRDPLRFHPEQGGPAPTMDVEELLRTLGYKTKQDPEEELG